MNSLEALLNHVPFNMTPNEAPWNMIHQSAHDARSGFSKAITATTTLCNLCNF